MLPKSKKMQRLGYAVTHTPVTQAQQLFAQATALYQKGQLAQTYMLCGQVLQVQPSHFDALYLMGIVAYQTRDTKSAIELMNKAIAINPQNADAYYNRGVVLQDIKQYQAAIESYDKAIALNPGYINAYYNRGIVLSNLQQQQAAIKSYDKAIALMPGYANAYNSRGNALQEIKQYLAAVESYDKAIALKHDYASAYNNRGNALRELRQHGAAIDSYNKAIALRPDYAEAYYNLGVALNDLNEHHAAIESYDRAIALKPDYASAHYNRGIALSDLKQYQAALESYDKAFALIPDYDFFYGMRLHTKMHLCDWSDIENQCNQLEARIGNGEKASSPFAVLAITNSLALQRKAAEIWVQSRYPTSYSLPKIHKYARHDKVRIGYFSADFRNHPGAHLMAGLFEHHDRSKFEIIAFYFGPNQKDEMRIRIESAFDKFIDVQTLTDEEITILSRRLEIDIAIDRNGHTAESRFGIFSGRAAPIQVGYLGYPGTTGADYIDYLIADRVVIPENNQRYFSEKIAYLPNSYQANDDKRHISDKQPTREEMGLPETGFVFCCFNNNYKIMPDAFNAWMQILKRVEGSVLWLLESNPQAFSNLRKEAAKRGINEGRLIFAKRMPLPEHLARHRLADLFLDAFPYNAHTTASDALWAGLPVLTRIGETFASRVAASLLNAIHLPELITSTQEEYEALAIELATNPARLREIKEKLENNRLTTPLFDTRLFTKHIEAAYMAMYERYQADMPPGHIYVQA